MKKNNLSINELSNKLVESLINNKDRLGLKVSKGPLGCQIIDAGIEVNGSFEAGLKIAEICLGGLGNVQLVPSKKINVSAFNLCVDASYPVLACLGSQYAGWSLNHKEFFSLGSGPVRSIVQKEDIFKELNYSDNSDKTTIILEVDKLPPLEIVEKVSNDSGINSKKISFILTPTTSLCGNIQVVSRVLEVAIHKVHELKFPLSRIIHGAAFSPLPPIAKDFLTGMGRTNDSIIYGGVVQLLIDGDEDDLIALARELPSSSSRDYGKPFKEIFKDNNNDFYKIDGSLFSPAKVIVNSKLTGKTYSFGMVNDDLIKKSFD